MTQESNSHLPRAILLMMSTAMGAYLFGISTGIINGLNAEQTIGLAGHVLLSGAMAGFVGAYVFQWISGRTVLLMMLKMGIAGSLFFGSFSFIKPEYAPGMTLNAAPIGAFVAGFVGGAVAGGIMWLFKR